jgi:hypothetical protein
VTVRKPASHSESFSRQDLSHHPLYPDARLTNQVPRRNLPRESKGAEGDAATRDSRLERIPSPRSALHLGEAHVRTCTLAPVSRFRHRLAAGRNTLSHASFRSYPPSPDGIMESGSKKKKVHANRGTSALLLLANQLGIRGIVYALLLLATTLQPTTFQLFSRSSLGVDDAGSSFHFWNRNSCFFPWMCLSVP